MISVYCHELDFPAQVAAAAAVVSYLVVATDPNFVALADCLSDLGPSTAAAVDRAAVVYPAVSMDLTVVALEKSIE